MKYPKFNIDDISMFLQQLSEFKKSLVAFSAGLLSVLAFAPIYIFPIYMMSLPILLLLSMNSGTVKDAFKFGYIFGLGHFFAGLYWIGNSFAVEPDIPNWAGFIMVALLASYLALFIGIVCGAAKYIHRNHTLKTHLINIILSFVTLWSIAEWLRGHLFTGFPWNLSGYIWGFSDIMLQSTAVWGIHGLSLITLIICFIPLVMLKKKYVITAPIFGVIILCGLIYYGYSRLDVEVENIEGVNLRIVQPNIKQQDKWSYENWGKNLVNYMDESEDDGSEGVTHVIWPETAVIYSLSEEPFRRQLIAQILDEGEALITGYPRRQKSSSGTKIFNSMIAINDKGETIGGYDKSHLVPFGEYIPNFIRNILVPLGVGEIFTGGQDYSEGDGLKTIKIDGLPPFSLVICYEIIFPGEVVNRINRPDWILNITNDAWYGESSGPYQHLLQSQVRAIEEGLPVVRSAGTGISAIIGPYGRIIDEIPLNSRGVINGKLPMKLASDTIYSNFREWIFICINVMFIILNVTLVMRNKWLSR